MFRPCKILDQERSSNQPPRRGGGKCGSVLRFSNGLELEKQGRGGGDKRLLDADHPRAKVAGTGWQRKVKKKKQ